MPRLPGIQYTVGVQSLGRHDVNAPIRVAQAQSKALMKIPGILESWSEAQGSTYVAEAAADYLEEMRLLEAEVTGQPTIDLNDPKYAGMGLEYDEQMVTEKEGQKFIPTFAVAEQIWFNRLEKLDAETGGKLKDRKSRNAFYQAVGASTATSSASVRKFSYKSRNDTFAATYDTDYDRAVKRADINEATRLANEAVRTGIWTPEHFTQQTEGLIGDVQKSGINARMASDDPEALRLLHDDLMFNLYEPSPGMYGKYEIDVDERRGLATEAMNKALRLEKQIVTDRDKGRADRSSELLNRTVLHLDETGQAYTSDKMAVLTAQLEPEDRKLLRIRNRAVKEQSQKVLKQSDFNVVQRLELDIASLGFPSTLDPAVRLKALTDKIYEMGAVDSGTGIVRDDVQQFINGSDVVRLVKMAQDFQKLPLQTAAYQGASDYMYESLTGRSAKAVYDLDPAEKIPVDFIVAQAQRDMMTAALKEGQRFNPQAWADQNLDKYATQTVRETFHELVKQGFLPYLVQDADENVVKGATLLKLSDALANLQIDRADYERAVRMVKVMKPPETK